MRLIEADELKEWIKNWLYKDSYYFPRRRKETIPISELYDVIDQVPTVDAVPVEWIKRWSKKPVTEKDTKLAEQCEWDILEWLIADWQRGK